MKLVKTKQKELVAMEKRRNLVLNLKQNALKKKKQLVQKVKLNVVKEKKNQLVALKIRLPIKNLVVLRNLQDVQNLNLLILRNNTSI